MPRKKKRRRRYLAELPPDRLLEKIFPKRVVRELHKIVHKDDDPEDDSQVQKEV